MTNKLFLADSRVASLIVSQAEACNGERILISSACCDHLLNIKDLNTLRDLADATLRFYESIGLTSDDIAIISHKMLEDWQLKSVVRSDERDEDRTKIYMILDKDSSHIKVGRSKNPESRLKSLQSATTHHLELLFVHDGVISDEAKLHRELSKYRVSGEWFIFCDEVVGIVSSFFNKQ